MARSETTPQQLPAHELFKLRDVLDTALRQHTTGSVVLTVDALAECREILERLLVEAADTKDKGKEPMDMDVESLAVMELAYGFVERGKGQPLVLSPIKRNDWLQKIERVINEINAEIREGVPILGDRDAPYPVSDTSKETLRALSHVLATRTQERIRLLTHDSAGSEL